jgi:hypothetical protein
MAALFSSGRIVDLILVFTALELLVLAVHRRRTGQGVPPLELVINLSSGVFLLLALRFALVEAWWGWIGFCLFGSLLAHFTDLWRRWR